MKDLRQIGVIGLGLLGGSITLAVLRSFPNVKTVGFAHRPATRRKARQLAVATEIVDDIAACVREADVVILATPISTFEQIFRAISSDLPAGCIVTDVGSTKVWPHRWARRWLPKGVRYVGSHPIAGSEQRGVEFARDDLFEGAACILTTTRKSTNETTEVLNDFWSKLGCCVRLMRPAEHDRIFASVSHLPHVTAAALINANKLDELKFAGKGFIDSSRIASGPANIWSDVLLSNADNVAKGIDTIVSELLKLQKAIKARDEKQIQKLLETAREKRNKLIDYKIKKKELVQ